MSLWCTAGRGCPATSGPATAPGSRACLTAGARFGIDKSDRHVSPRTGCLLGSGGPGRTAGCPPGLTR